VTLSRETILGIAAVAVAGIYFSESTKIQQSLLSDAVGADGVPRILAIAMALVGLLLALRGLARKQPAADEAPKNALPRAAGLLAILIVYLLAMPHLGYPLGIASLVAAVAVFAGARANLTLAATAVAGAVFFWLVFDRLLGIAMPLGVLSWG
jgi:putative tricarboxylic transport membrane protein